MAITRRALLASTGAAVAVGRLRDALADEDDPPRSPIGIGAASYMHHRRQLGDAFIEPLRFLRFCRDRGAAGIQAPLGVLEAEEARRVRREAERLAMDVEGSVGLPRGEADLDRFRTELRTVRECGGRVARTFCHAGRRYEVFGTAQEYREFLDGALDSLQRAEPVARAEGVRLAVENHKDMGAERLAAMIRMVSSAWVGATVDFGNNLALLESPEETARILAPFAVSTHLKDARVATHPAGFLLGDVPLGEGVIDVPGIVRVLRAANPEIRLTLEMITRDPLLVPCLEDRYWETCEAPGRRLAAALRFVRDHEDGRLPEVGPLAEDRRRSLEDANVRRSLTFAAEHLASE